MFGLFKKKSEIDVLQKKYEKLMSQWHELSSINRAESDKKVKLVYHGLDLERFPQPTNSHSNRTGSNPDDPVRFLSVGRAVEKKGLDTLLQALAQLPDSLHWNWTHIAGGPLLNNLKEQAAELGLTEKVSFLLIKPR